jgi:hypothetical protein
MDACQSRTIASNFCAACGMQEHFFLTPKLPVFFSVFMTADNFVFGEESFAAVTGILNSDKRSSLEGAGYRDDRDHQENGHKH